MLASAAHYLIPYGFAIFLEIFLTGTLIALIGAAGYTFFVYSMKDDRADQIAKLYYDNPWDKVNEHTANNKPQKSRRKKGTLIGILLLLAAVIVLLLLIWVLHIVYPVIQIT